MSQRQWLRFPSEVDSVNIESSGLPTRPADVLDESFTGIALMMDDAHGLSKNSRVSLEYRGKPREATIRYIVPASNGRYRIGIQWEEAPERVLATAAG